MAKVPYGTDVEKTYHAAKDTVKSVERDVIHEICKRGSEGKPYEVVYYCYMLEACSIIKSEISKEPELAPPYDMIYALTDKNAVKDLVNTLADSLRVTRGLYKLHPDNHYRKSLTLVVDECFDDMYIPKGTDLNLRRVYDTNLIVAFWRPENLELARKSGFSLIEVPARVENQKAKQEDFIVSDENNMMYAIDTPENREILKQYYGMEL